MRCKKFLNEAYVPQNMTQRTKEHLVRRIHATNDLYFTKDKLDTRGTSHNKPLYINIRCKDCTIGNTSVDNGLTLNVLPKHMLIEMLVDSTHMLPRTMTTQVYNGSLKQVVITIEIELFIGPRVFLSNFESDGHLPVIQNVTRKALDTRH
jgi:hypothetical protein